MTTQNASITLEISRTSVAVLPHIPALQLQWDITHLGSLIATKQVDVPLIDPVAPAAWQASTAYTRGAVVTADGGKLYKCVGSGVSGDTGPSGDGDAIMTDGSARWKFGPQFVQVLSDGLCTFVNPTDLKATWATMLTQIAALQTQLESESWVAYGEE